MILKEVEIYSDGACKGNPGPGGWGVLLRYGVHERSFYGYDRDTTNNRMELTAVIMALEALNQPCVVTVTTDSSYVVQSVKNWLSGWRNNGWKKANNKPVLNSDLWERLATLLDVHSVTFSWVKGHAGHPENELCDRLANIAIKNGT